MHVYHEAIVSHSNIADSMIAISFHKYAAWKAQNTSDHARLNCMFSNFNYYAAQIAGIAFLLRMRSTRYAGLVPRLTSVVSGNGLALGSSERLDN